MAGTSRSRSRLPTRRVRWLHRVVLPRIAVTITINDVNEAPMMSIRSSLEGIRCRSTTTAQKTNAVEGAVVAAKVVDT